MSEKVVDQLQTLISTIEKVHQTIPDINETNTKFKIINPLIDILGWDTRNLTEVVMEYQIQMGTTTAYVDYALCLQDEVVVFIEAKPLGKKLTKSDGNQIISYCRVEGTRWCGLTNGKEFIIYDAERGRFHDECIIWRIKYSKYIDEMDKLFLLSKDSILSKDIDKKIDTHLRKKKAIRMIERDRSELEQKIVRSFRRIFPNAKDIIKDIENISPQIVDLLLAEVRNDRGEPEPQEQAPETEESGIDLGDLPDGDVIVCPSKPDGVDFLKKYNAWGFIRLNKIPRYFTLYITRPVSGIQYFGEVDRVVDPEKDPGVFSSFTEEDMDGVESGKKVLLLKEGSLRKLRSPIKFEPGGLIHVPRYTTLELLKKARTTKDLWDRRPRKTPLSKTMRTSSKDGVTGYFGWEIEDDRVLGWARRENPYRHSLYKSDFLMILDKVIDAFGTKDIVTSVDIRDRLKGKVLPSGKKFNARTDNYKLIMTFGVLEIEELIKWKGGKRPRKFSCKGTDELELFRRNIE